MSDYDISGMTDEEKAMPKYTYGHRIPYEWVDDIITKLHQYQEAFESIRTEIEEQILDSLSDGGNDWFTAEKVNECLEIIDKHDPSKAGKEKE